MHSHTAFIHIVRQGSIYWGAGGEASPPKKVLLKKKITAISNKDLF